MAISPENFNDAMEALGLDGFDVGAIGVAVSGGPDSMALCRLLADWTLARGIAMHALSVDHGLRAEAADEAARVGGWLAGWPGVWHQVLRWESPAISAVQEKARKARYGLMADYCRTHGLSYLFLAHHRDDQAETVLFRLAKGSGLDGLAGMQGVSAYDEDLTLVRPLLDFEKADLLAYCVERDVPYVQDPGNDNPDFARVRLRQARAVLEAEGLSAKRLAVTAQRLARARKALQILALQVYKGAIIENDTKRITLKLSDIMAQPEEMVLRCVLQALADLRPEADYAPRMEKVEALVADLIASQNRDEAFRKRTLGGLAFVLDKKTGRFVVSVEGQKP